MIDGRIRDHLEKIAWRLRVSLVARWSLVGWLGIGGAALLLGGVRMAGGSPPFTVEIVALALGAGALVALVALASSRVDLAEAARRADGEMGGADGMLTAFALEAEGTWRELVTRQAVAATRGAGASAVVGWRWRWGVAWAMAPVLIAVGMALTFRTVALASETERERAADVLDKAANVLAEGTMEDLAEAREGLLQEAGELREKLSDGPRDDALRALARAGAAVERLRGERATDGNDGRAGDAGEAGELSDSIVEGLLREADRAAGEARRLAESELEQMAERLEEMKRALRSPGAESLPGDEAAGEDALAQLDAAMGVGQEAAAAGESQSDLPGGGPGSERDIGGGGELFGEKTEVDVDGLDDRTGSDQGEGAAVTVGTVSVDGPGRANVNYREVYDEAARAAEGAVEREELPYGSRELVRRYFDRIKPE